MRLLLAEDELALSKALKAILERNNYSVDAVYGSDNYDGVILDIMMPKLIELWYSKKSEKKKKPDPGSAADSKIRSRR